MAKETEMILEFSRQSQLSDAGKETVAKVAAEYGVTVSDLSGIISSTVENTPVEVAVKASNWYVEAHEFVCDVAAQYDITPEKVAGVVSAVSPRMPWLRNKNVAQAIIANHGDYAELSANDAAKQIGLALGNNVFMAFEILRGKSVSAALSGVKRRNFYNNIISPLKGDSVTVDTWMMESYCRFAGVPKKSAEDFVRAAYRVGALNGTGVGYYMIADAVRIVARAMDITPASVQAIFWVSVAGNHNGGRTHTL